ncbi:MAG: sensor histidine kinase [Alkalispirochaeta sp.]
MKIETRFRQISILFALLLVAFVVTLTVRRAVTIPEFSVSDLLGSHTTIIYSIFAALFLILTGMPENRASRLAQILILMGLGVAVTGYIAPRELGGDIVFVIAAALAYKYGMLRTRPIVKIGSIFTALMLARVAGFVFLDTMSLDRMVNQIVAIMVAIPVLYWVFENEFLHLQRMHRELQSTYQEQQPFMEFGRNVTGIVHDFKNDLALFDAFGQFLAISENEPLDPRQVRRYRSYVSRLAERIERVTLITTAAQRYEEDEGDLRTLLESALYVFQSNLTYRREISFHISFPEEPLMVRVPPAPLVSIVENLLSNSCEALMEQAGSGVEYGASRIQVSTQRVVHGIEIRIEDTGPGLPFCRRCVTGNCLYCPSVAVGHTTKAHGSGIGLTSIRWHSEKHGIPVHLSNLSSGGVRAVITIGESRVISPQESCVAVDG